MRLEVLITLLALVSSGCDSNSASATDVGASDGGGGGADLGKPAATDPTAEEIAKGVLVVASCSSGGYLGFALNESIQRLYGELRTVDYWAKLSCIAKAGGCAGIKSCLGLEIKSAGTPCSPSGDHSEQCSDSDTYLFCEGNGYYRSCKTLFGVGCESVSGPSGTRAGCSTGSACTLNEARCVGDYLARCKDGQELYDEKYVCPWAGLKCKGGECAGPEEACSFDKPKCEGNTIAFCIGGYAARHDCAALGSGFSCQQSANGATCTQGTECDPTTAQQSCDGNSAVVCNAGKTTKIDCLALGFKGCMGGLCTTCDLSSVADRCSGSTLTLCEGDKLTTLDCKAAGWTTCKNNACSM